MQGMKEYFRLKEDKIRDESEKVNNKIKHLQKLTM